MGGSKGPRLGEVKDFTHSPLPTAGCRELLNPWCSLVTLTAHLRQRGQVPQDGEGEGRAAGEEWPRASKQGYQPCPASLPGLPASIALLSEDGHLVSLEEGASQAPPMGSTLLQERGTYVLVQIISKWGPRPLGLFWEVRGAVTVCTQPAGLGGGWELWPVYIRLDASERSLYCCSLGIWGARV